MQSQISLKQLTSSLARIVGRLSQQPNVTRHYRGSHKAFTFTTSPLSVYCHILLFRSPPVLFFSSMFFTIFQLFKRQTHNIADSKMPSFLLISLTVFLTAWSATAAVNNGKCYHGNQIQDGTNSPCDPEAEVSSCCHLGFICLSNGLCEPSVNASQYVTPYFSSTCTDYSWNSPSVCVGMCENNKTR